MATIKVKVEEHDNTHTRFTVDRGGEVSSALMPHDPDEDEELELVGGPWILRAATCAYDGDAEAFELTDEEMAERGGGYWPAP